MSYIINLSLESFVRLVCPFSTLYTTLPQTSIKEKVIDLIERIFKKTFKKEGNIYMRFVNKFYRYIVGIPTGTNCAPPVADFFFILLRKIFHDFSF